MIKTTCVGILGSGAYLPERVLTNEELAQQFGVTPDWIFERTGIRERRIVSQGQACSHLAIAAARQAFENAAVLPDEIDLIILATSNGDAISPAASTLVQHDLGATRAACYDLSAACSGFVYALITGCHLIHSGLFGKVLVIGSEVMSRLMQHDRNTNILFGDGAGAVVLGAVPEGYGLLEAMDMGTDGSRFDIAFIPKPVRCNWFEGPGTPAQPLGIRMDGQAVFAFGMRVIGKSIQRLLSKAGLTMDDIDLLIPHQANQRIISAAALLLDLPEEKIIQNIEHYGNTSAASIPIALHQALENRRVRHGNLVALVGFGAGLSWGSCLLRWYSPGGNQKQAS